MKGQLDAALLRHREHRPEKIAAIVPQLLLPDAPVAVQQGLELRRSVVGPPAGQLNAPLRVHGPHLFLLKAQAVRAVGEDMGQIGTGPVKDRHEVVADDPDAALRQHADVFPVVFDEGVPGGIAPLDVLVNAEAVHKLKLQAVGLDLLLQAQHLRPVPHLPQGQMIEGGDNAVQVGNLRVLAQGDGVLLPVPAENQVHVLHGGLLSTRRRRPPPRPRVPGSGSSCRRTPCTG